MAYYPKFHTSSNSFNSRDIVSSNNDDAGNTVVTLNLSNFLEKSAPVLENDLYLKNAKINFGGLIQSTAFDDIYKDNLETNTSKLTNIEYNSNTTTINNNLDLTNANVNFSDEHIPINKITNLADTLVGIQTNLNNINSNDTDILNIQTDITNNIKPDILQNSNDITNNKNIYDNYVFQNDTDKVNMNSNISSNETKNVEQDDRLDLIESKDLEQDGRLNLIETKNTNQDNRLDLIESKNTEQDGRLNLIESKDLEQDGKLDLIESKNTEQDNRLSVNENKNTEQDNRLSVNENKNIEQDNRLDLIETKNTNQDDRLDLIETKNTNQDNRLNINDALIASNTNDLSILTTQQNTHTSQISSLENGLLTKQNIINNANKLNVAYLGNGDVNNDKLSALNNIRTDVTIQYQLNTLENNLNVLDGLQDIDLVNIPILQNDVTDLKANKIIQDNSINLIEIDVTNIKAKNTTQDNLINTANTNINNNSNSITTINNNITNLANADVIHDGQITALQNADVVLQSNIDLKQNIIDVNNKIDSALINDSNLNDTLDNLLITLNTNIGLIDASKQNKISALNKLNSSYLNRNDNLVYFDINSSLNGRLSNIDANISLLQGVDSTIINDIQYNFDSHDASINALQNSISTLQGLQDGDIISFQNINNSITNLTNSKHPLINSDNKLNSSLLNRDDNLVFCDVSSSIKTSLDNLQLTKQNLLNNTDNKLNYDKIDFSTSNIRFADYPNSINDKMISLDSQINTLISNDTTQISTNTNLQNQINTNTSNINLKQDVIDVNNKISISNVDLTGSNLVNVDYGSSINDKFTSLDADFLTKQDVIDVNNKLSSSLINRDDNLQYVDVTSSIQEQLDLIASSSGAYSLVFNGTGVNIFNHLTFGTRMPNSQNAETEMSFTINDMEDHFNGDYKCIQSSYYGSFDFAQNPVAQLSTSRSMVNLFTPETIADGSFYRTAYNNIWFKDTSKGILIQYKSWPYDFATNTGNYVGNTTTNSTGYSPYHQTTATNDVTYAGEYLEFHFPFLYEISKVKMTGGTNTSFLPSETALLGSNDGTNWEFIDQLSYARNTVTTIDHNISTTKKYSKFKLIFQQISSNAGVTIEHLDFEGDVYNTFDFQTFSSSQTATNENLQNQITTNASNISNLQTQINLQNSQINSIQAVNTNALENAITTNTNNISTNTNNIATNTNNITTNTNDIATNTNNITTNTNDILTLQTQFNNLSFPASKTEDINETLSFTQASNILTHTYDEKNIYLNNLDDNNVITFNLTINSPENYKNYVQVVIIDALEYKSFINTLNINDENVEIKFRDGDDNINLAPIAGYSKIIQTLNMTRFNDEWFCMSSIELFYNTTSNIVYDPYPPVIFLTGSSNISHEINTSWNELGYVAYDDPGNIDLTNDVIVTGDTNPNTSILGAVYNIYYNLTDAAGNNAIQKIRTINIVDTTAPVITLTNPTLDLTVGDTYLSSSAGASASDNSNEVLTITVDETNVDTSQAGSFIVTFSTQDSTGNSHSINQVVTVSVPNLTLQYSNPNQDIFQLLNFETNIQSNTTNTTKTQWTLSGQGDAWKDGTYHTLVTSMRETPSGFYDSLFSNLKYSQNSKFFEFISVPYISNHYIYGNQQMTSDGWGTGGVFQPYTVDNGSIDFYTEGCETGEYIEVSFPFHIKPSKFTVRNEFVYPFKKMQIAGKSNNGNWVPLGIINANAVLGSYNLNVTTTAPGYNTFRYILYQVGTDNRTVMENIYIYGDVYK